MRILLDMNMSPRFVPLLLQAGHETRHWSELGEIHAPDWSILRYALEQEYVVLTFDLDFGTLLSATRVVGPSVVLVRPYFAHPEDIIQQLLMALANSATELETGALVLVESKRIRVRLLPL